MAFILTADQKVTLSINPVDAYGNPAVVDGVPVWSTSDDTKVTVEAAVDGLSATITAVGPVASGVQISVIADADLGAGVKEITGLLAVDVIAGEAAGLSVNTGEPEPKE